MNLLFSIEITNLFFYLWRQLWQAFIGIGARRVKGYYKGLLAVEGELKEKTEIVLTMKCGYRKPKASQPFSSEKGM